MYDKRICEILKDLGVPVHLKGHMYLRESIEIALEHPEYIDSLVKKVYSIVAQRLNSTPSRVERAIRHAIEYTFSNTAVGVLYHYFGHTTRLKDGKVTNKCFIATIADYIKMEVK